MSRARLFKRAANWLKNCMQTQQQIAESKRRRAGRQFAFGQLEERVVLDADFNWDSINSTLELDGFNPVGVETLEISETADYYQFTLSDGTWFGTDDPGGDVMGFGLQTLSVAKDFGGTTLVADALGIDINFAGVNFDDAGTLVDIQITGDELTQTGSITADTVTNFELSAQSIELGDAGNDFNAVSVEANGVELGDLDDLALSNVNVTNSLSVEAGGAINLATDVDVPLVRLMAGDGVTQGLNTFLAADELLLQGVGDFDLTEGNRIGDTFNAGALAADIDGSLAFNNDFDIEFGEVTYSFLNGLDPDATFEGVDIDAGASTGNLTITTSQDDVGQTETGVVSVEGLASFNTGIGSVNLVTAFLANDFNEIQIVLADDADVSDIDGMTIVGTNVDDQASFSTLGKLIIREEINAGERLFLNAFDGATQELSSVLNAEELIVFGEGDFLLDENNTIENVNGLGLIAVSVDGLFSLKNSGTTRVDTLSYTIPTTAPADFEIEGVEITGDFQVELPDADFTQANDAPFRVVEDLMGDGGTSTFILGTGCLELPFADNTNDNNNDNDFDLVKVTTASIVDISDSNGYSIGESVVSDKAKFSADAGIINIDEDLRVVNQLLFVSMGGMTQSLGTNIETPEIMFYGAGDFVLDQLNSIGNSGTPGQIAAMIDGSLEIKNDFGLNISSLSYENKDSSTVDLVGITLDNTTGSGDVKFELDNADLTQSSDSPITVDGLTTFDMGTAGTVNLPFSDTIVDDELEINENDFNTVAVDNGFAIEFNDINSVTIVGAFTNNRLAVTSDTADIVLDGTVNVNTVVKLDAMTGVTQTSGVIDTASLMLLGQGEFNLNQLNDLGNGFAGIVAASVTGNINLINANKVQVGSISYTDLNAETTTVLGVGATDTSNVGIFRLRADGIELWQPSVASTVVFESTGGISQQDTVTTDGLIDANDFSLSGAGFANLAENNLIGTDFGPGDVAIDWAGDLRLRSVYGVDFDEVAFEFDSGFMRTDANVDVSFGGGAVGNFELFAGGDITDAGDIDTFVQGIASFVANDGNSDIVIGDAFSNMGGLNNEVHFGSIGLKARNATVHEDSEVALDGTWVTGDLEIISFGNIRQTGSDPFSNVGTSGVSVQGDANFVVDSDDDSIPFDVLLMARENGELIDNFFVGPVSISGTKATLGLNGAGVLQDVQFRNSAFEVSAFPEINNSVDSLRNLHVWTPESSAVISQDVNVSGNFLLFAGVESSNGILGGSLEVTNTSLNRRISDSAGTDIIVGGNAIFEAGNTISLADDATDTLNVGRKLQASTHGGDVPSRIRIGVANSGIRGTDSGATVNADRLRFRARPTFVDRSEHVTINVDNSVELTGSNVARSLVLVVDGSITDDSDADMIIRNSTTFVANGGDIMLGESFSRNFIDNNAVNFGTLSVFANNVDIVEDSATLLDGVKVSGDFSITSKGHIRQSGQDRFKQAGTEFIEVGGDATFKVDKEQLPTDQVNDLIGQDVKIMANQQRKLMDNVIEGEITVTSTAFDGTQNQRGSVRNVEIRNTSVNAKDPIFNLAGADRVRNMTLWVTNTGLNLRNDMSVANNLRIHVGVDSIDGMSNGRLQVVDNSAIRNLTDSAGVNLLVGRNLDVRVSNRIQLADNAADSIRVDNRASFITQGGRQGNGILVGTSPNGPRGNDSGALFETDVLRYRAPVGGQFGNVTIVVDSPFSVTPDSQAKSAVII